jgi:hypothetical protein
MKTLTELRTCVICGLEVQDLYLDCCDICLDDETLELSERDNEAA